MRNWKRILGLSKLSAMAALALSSCNPDDDLYTEEFMHTGYCAQWDAGWTYAPHPDVYPDFFHQESDADTIKLRDNIVEIVIHDTCSETEQDGQECKKCNDYNRHSIFSDPRRARKLKFDLHTADTVLFKKFFFPADYSLDIKMNQWAKVVKEKQTDDKRFYLSYKQPNLEHHVHNPADCWIKPEDIVSVFCVISR